MSTPREQYDAMLDDLPDEAKLSIVSHVPFAKLLEDTDPVAYRCGCNDFQATCDECHREYWADDPDEEAVCPECAKAQDEEDEEDEEDEAPAECECDNTHEQNGTVCRWCWARGRRVPSDPDVA